MRLTEDMQRAVIDQRLGFVATVCPDATPNLSPKGTTTVYDDEHVVFADVASPGTMRNLRANDAIEINVVDPLLRKGYRLKGRASLHADGEIFAHTLELFAERDIRIGVEPIGARHVRTVVLVHVEEAAPLVSPAYRAGATEAETVRSWLQHYTALHGERTSDGALGDLRRH